MKRLSLCLLLLAAALTSAHATSGIFGTGVVLSVNGTKTLFESTLLGDSRQSPTGVTGLTLNTTGFNNQNLGTFNISTGATLNLLGGEALTYKNGTDDITGASVWYKIDGGAFTQINMSFNQDNVSGNTGDQRWYTESSNVNVLSGLSNGAHTIAVYYQSPYTFSGGSGTHTENNSNANFTASFTVVPEPSTVGLMAVSAVGMVVMLRRRRSVV